MKRVDVLVIGGGAGGLTATREAVRRGASTLLVSEGPLGGDCTHTGCVPSKTLLTAAAAGASFSDAMAAVRARIDTIAATEDAALLRSEGIEVIEGRARLAGGGHVLGATTVAPTAGEMIGEVALAMRTKMFTGRLAQATHAYPTWSMAIQETAAQFFMTYQGRTARPAQLAE